MLTYESQAAKDADKELLERCREALDVTGSVMRLDDCGLWNLAGRRGRITTWGDGKGYLLAIYELRSRLAWTWAKRRLAFAELKQNAEIEGVFQFELPITVEQAAEIRALAGLRVAPSEEVSAMRAEQAQRAGFGRKNGRGEVGGTEMGSDPGERVLQADTADVAA